MYHVSHEGSETEKYSDFWFIVKMTATAAGQIIDYQVNQPDFRQNKHKLTQNSRRLSGLHILHLMKIDLELLISSQRIAQKLRSHLGSVGFPLMKRLSR